MKPLNLNLSIIIPWEKINEYDCLNEFYKFLDGYYTGYFNGSLTSYILPSNVTNLIEVFNSKMFNEGVLPNDYSARLHSTQFFRLLNDLFT